MNATVYTDGSCHTQRLVGAWAAMLMIGGGCTTLKGLEQNTTHNRMELLAVIKAIDFLDTQTGIDKIVVYSDSQYVVNLVPRMEKLLANDFITKGGKVRQNSDLLRILIRQMQNHQVEFVKVKAHQKDGDAYNRQVDILVRNLVRENIHP